MDRRSFPHYTLALLFHFLYPGTSASERGAISEEAPIDFDGFVGYIFAGSFILVFLVKVS